jgi:hypothetical protein
VEGLAGESGGRPVSDLAPGRFIRARIVRAIAGVLHPAPARRRPVNIRDAISKGWEATRRGGQTAGRAGWRSLAAAARLLARVLALGAKAAVIAAGALSWASSKMTTASAWTSSRGLRPATAAVVPSPDATMEIAVLPTPEPAPVVTSRTAPPPPPGAPRRTLSPHSVPLPSAPPLPSPPSPASQERAWQLLIDGVKSTAGAAGRPSPAAPRDPRAAAVVEFHPLATRLPGPRGSGSKGVAGAASGAGLALHAGAIPTNEG